MFERHLVLQIVSQFLMQLRYIRTGTPTASIFTFYSFMIANNGEIPTNQEFCHLFYNIMIMAELEEEEEE